MCDASTSEENAIVTCFNCTLQIQRTVHIKCAECTVNVCILCFQFGAESGEHRRGHNYQITDPLCASASCGEWGFLEESRLLKAAHQFKMGNWGEIVESMGGNRREALDAKEYFDKVFIRGWMGQFAIKNSDWDRIKYEMLKNGTLDSVLKANSVESTERLLMLRDALLESDNYIDPKDPKLMSKIQHLLEGYVKRCIEGKIEIRWERSKPGGSIYETEISSDECDPAEYNDVKLKSKKNSDFFGLDPEDESDLDAIPESKKPRKENKKHRRLLRDTSSDTEHDESPSNDVDLLHGLEREAEEEDSDGNTECDEETESSTPGTSTVRRKKKKRSRLWLSKRERQLKAYRVKMNSQHKKREQDLKKLATICPLEEMSELRNALPRLALEKRGSDKTDKLRIRQDDLRMVGYNVDREEFENEWFNEAEHLISRLTINPAPAEKDLLLDIENDIKFARIQNYIRIQGIRRAKRNAILEHEKIPQFFNFIKSSTLEKRRPIDVINDRSEMDALLVKTQQFLTAEEFKTLYEAITSVETLKNKITKLQEMQKNGETSLKNVHINGGSANGRRGRKKLKKTEKDMHRRASLKWAQYQRWHKSAV